MGRYLKERTRANEVKSTTRRTKQVPDRYGVLHSTCSNCKRAAEPSTTVECVDCLENDVQGDRFPNWEKPDGTQIK